MTYADKIAEAPERIWAWEIDFDGWWDTEKPDWIETPVAYTRADLADAQAQEIARLRKALERIATHSDDTVSRVAARATLGDTP